MLLRRSAAMVGFSNSWRTRVSRDSRLEKLSSCSRPRSAPLGYKTSSSALAYRFAATDIDSSSFIQKTDNHAFLVVLGYLRFQGTARPVDNRIRDLLSDISFDAASDTVSFLVGLFHEAFYIPLRFLKDFFAFVRRFRIRLSLQRRNFGRKLLQTPL